MRLQIAWFALVACSADGAGPPASPPLDTVLARELTARFGVPVTVRCSVFGVRCRAELGDGSELAMIVAASGGAWEWRSEGTAIDTAPLAAYVDGVLADLGVASTARCGPRIARTRRITCQLSGGGAAFLAVRPDGQLGLELALGPAVAAVRAVAFDPGELARASHALAHHLDGDPDDP
jgi:hypothetical protein